MEHHFTGTLDRQETNFRYHMVHLPAEVAAAFKAEGVKRVLCQVNGTPPLRRALIGDGDGGAYVILAMETLRVAKAKPGGRVEMTVWADPNPNEIDIPEEFAELMAQDEAVAAKFNAITPGRQRSLMIYITQAKGAETRVKRALEMGRKLVTETLHSQKNE